MISDLNPDEIDAKIMTSFEKFALINDQNTYLKTHFIPQKVIICLVDPQTLPMAPKRRLKLLHGIRPTLFESEVNFFMRDCVQEEG